jgi:hypothetical protein
MLALTLTLSPGEREQVSGVAEKSVRLVAVAAVLVIG